MFNSRTLAVIKRELREKLFSRTFILMTLLIPVFLFGILGLQTFFLSYSGEGTTKLQVVTESEQMTAVIKKELQQENFVQNKTYDIVYLTMSKEMFSDYLNKMRQNLTDEKLTAIVFVANSSLKEKNIDFYSKNPNNPKIFEKLKNPINKAFASIYFSNKGFSESDFQYVSKNVGFNNYRVSKDNKIEHEGYGNLIISFLFTFILYFSLLFTGSMMMRSVVQEKNNRIVEVLLSSVDSRELMTGKIIGTSITGLLQMAIWMSPFMILISTSWFLLPKELVFKLNMSEILYFLLNYLVGLITFMGLFASMGAIFDNEQDAQSGMWPVMMLIMIPFFIGISLQSNPGSPIGRIASMFPFASILVMPARMTLVELPVWQIGLSLLINLITMSFVFMLAGKIYRVGILMTGKKPKWSEVARWLRYKY
ncbi:MAG: ABC transporter permease [Ignavibacteriales bacterium]